MEGTVENVFKDFRGRQAALIRALTTELDEFYTRCDPNEENLCLFAYPDETWEVCLPEVKVPPEIPEPVLGINAARDEMDKKDWLKYVAAQSDAWLMSVAAFFGEILHFDKRKRTRLFQMVNGLPTVSEVITGTENKQTKAKKTQLKACRRRRRKSDCLVPKPRWQSKRKPTTLALPEKDEDSKEEEEEEDEKGGAVDEYPVDLNEGTVEKAFKDFTARRAALIRALTTEVDEFYTLCDPRKNNLCLFAYPDERWEVCPPEEIVPPDIPEPVLGINAARDEMDRKDWLVYIAAQSDAWLMSLAFFEGKFQFDKKTRTRLFQMVNGLPTVSEVITGTENKQIKAKKTQLKARRCRRRKSDCWGPKPRWRRKRKPTTLALPDKDEDGEEEEEEGAVDKFPDDVCGACRDKMHAANLM